MYMNLNKIMFFNTMIIGVVVSVSSNNWVNMWAGMEIGVLSIVPMMTQEKTSSDSPIKYFIIQSISSSLMILSTMMMNSEMNFKMILLLAMLMKIGASPFHIWVLSMVEGLNFNTMFLMFTFIKIPGMVTMSMLNEQMQIWSMLSMMIGSIMAINQSSIKKIMAYSSIYNVGIMMSSINENQIWVNYFIIYSFTLILLMTLLTKLKMSYLNQVIINEVNSMTKITLWILMMSMAGLPPLMGFPAKMMILEKMIMKKEIMMSMTMILSSMVIMFLYMRISFMSMMLKSMINKWKLMKTSNVSIMVLLMNIMLTPMVLTFKNLT